MAKLNPDLAEQLYTAYVTRLRAGVPGTDTAEWTELQIGDWEHSRPLHGDTLGTVLGGSLDKRSVQRSRSRSRQLAEVLSIEAKYVAVVDGDHRFVSLVDRQALLEELTGLRPSPPSRVVPADVRDEGSGRCLTVALCVPLLAAHRRQVAFWGRGPTGALP